MPLGWPAQVSETACSTSYHTVRAHEQVWGRTVPPLQILCSITWLVSCLPLWPLFLQNLHEVCFPAGVTAGRVAQDSASSTFLRACFCHTMCRHSCRGLSVTKCLHCSVLVKKLKTLDKINLVFLLHNKHFPHNYSLSVLTPISTYFFLLRLCYVIIDHIFRIKRAQSSRSL